MQVFMTAILTVATLFLVGANASTGDGIVASTLTLTGTAVITISTASTTTDPAAISATPNTNPSASISDTNVNHCYPEGETWDQLGTWDEINRALQNSRIVRVTFIPGGYHVSSHA